MAITVGFPTFFETSSTVSNHGAIADHIGRCSPWTKLRQDVQRPGPGARLAAADDGVVADEVRKHLNFVNGLVKGKIETGNHRFSHQIWGFPVNFPLKPIHWTSTLLARWVPFIVDFPINSMVIFHSYVTNYQRVPWPMWVCYWKCWVNIPNEIAIFYWDNDHENHWVQWGTLFSDTPRWRNVGWSNYRKEWNDETHA